MDCRCGVDAGEIRAAECNAGNKSGKRRARVGPSCGTPVARLGTGRAEKTEMCCWRVKWRIGICASL
jgi:hypothetical protein